MGKVPCGPAAICTARRTAEVTAEASNAQKHESRTSRQKGEAMSNVFNSMMDRLKKKQATERQQAVDTLAELLAEDRYTSPRPGDEDRLAAAMTTLGIHPDELEAYREFIAVWEADRKASADLDALRQAWRDASAEQRTFEAERERTIADLQKQSDLHRGRVGNAHGRFSTANHAASQVTWREKVWADFGTGKPLFGNGAPVSRNSI